MAVVVVAAAVEHVRLELVAGEEGVQQVVGDIADVARVAEMGRSPLTAPRTCTSSCAATTGRNESVVSALHESR